MNTDAAQFVILNTVKNLVFPNSYQTLRFAQGDKKSFEQEGSIARLKAMNHRDRRYKWLEMADKF